MRLSRGRIQENALVDRAGAESRRVWKSRISKNSSNEIDDVREIRKEPVTLNNNEYT